MGADTSMRLHPIGRSAREGSLDPGGILATRSLTTTSLSPKLDYFHLSPRNRDYFHPIGLDMGLFDQAPETYDSVTNLGAEGGLGELPHTCHVRRTRAFLSERTPDRKGGIRKC